MPVTRTFYVLAIVSAALLSGCSKSEEYYMENEDEAFAKVEECAATGDRSEECRVANVAVINIKRDKNIIEREARQAEALAKEKAYEETFNTHVKELSQLSHADFLIAYRDKSNEIRHSAARSIYNEMMDREVNRIRNEVGDKNIAAFKKQHCSGLEMDEDMCAIAKKIEDKVEREYEEKYDAKIKYLLENRSELKASYNGCAEEIYKLAGLPLPQNGKSKGALVSVWGAMKLLEESRAFECKAASDAAMRLDIQDADAFVPTL